ncbi:MAG: hypothetical protein U5R14_05035 [Gemmatimonadota bacterium]|nr:hypothetical protein [Gemmatimonadota bacterium]
MSRSRVLALALAGFVVCVPMPPTLVAQAPTMGSTLRYGSGLLDNPVSSVLPHLTIRGTYSGFWADLDRRMRIDDEGGVAGFDPGGREYHADAALTVGLFDRAEMGLSVQSLGAPSSGGDVWGLFGRMRLFHPVDQGIGLAVGGRYLTRPDFGDGSSRAPGRLGLADPRLRKTYAESDRPMRTRTTLYGVATAYLRGFDGGRLPENDLTLSLGWGSGLFRENASEALYGESSNGWFAGASSHWSLGSSSVLILMAEHNGFDVNVGAQVDVSGVRVGVHYLGANHPRPTGGYASPYKAPKLGVLASISVCPEATGLRCGPRTMERVEPDTVRIPPPPPDTVRVGTAALPSLRGQPDRVCLSTGQSVPIRVTATADTLVGAAATPIGELRPTVEFAGTYAGGAGWFVSGEDVVFEDRVFRKSEDAFPIDCGEILRVGTHEGVPVFADRAAIRPLEVLFIPVRVGLWQRYEWAPGRDVSYSRAGEGFRAIPSAPGRHYRGRFSPNGFVRPVRADGG